jgi:hypothetical protein
LSGNLFKLLTTLIENEFLFNFVRALGAIKLLKPAANLVLAVSRPHIFFSQKSGHLWCTEFVQNLKWLDQVLFPAPFSNVVIPSSRHTCV